MLLLGLCLHLFFNNRTHRSILGNYKSPFTLKVKEPLHFTPDFSQQETGEAYVNGRESKVTCVTYLKKYT